MARIERGIRFGNGFGDSRCTARAMRAVGVVAGGAEACPPSPRAVRRSVSTPFSPTPTIAAGTFTNGRGASTTAPPSSSTSHGVRRRSRNRSAIAAAAAPWLSSLPPRERYTSRAGVNPSASRFSTASSSTRSGPLSSSVPRPCTDPSWMRPSNGGNVQPSSSTAGTTS